MASKSASKLQYPLGALFVATAGCALFLSSVRIGIESGILMWIIMWDLGGIVGILTAFLVGKRLRLKTAVLSASMGSAFVVPLVFLYFVYIDGIDESLRQLREEPVFVFLLPFTGIVGFGYGGFLGLFSYWFLFVVQRKQNEQTEGSRF
ncbi:MAG: hypothetical protein SGI77_00170 [Pirellulaceae bacterium]|nr:hypothetical protein [Pirellulaceae bacterium]